MIVLALYKGEAFVNLYISDYSGMDISFAVDEKYDYVKVFILNDIHDWQPICADTNYINTTKKFLDLCNNTNDEWTGITEALMSGLYKYYNYDIISVLPSWDIQMLAKEMYYIQSQFDTVQEFDEVCKQAYQNLHPDFSTR